QLVAQLQSALDTALGTAGFTAGDIVVKRAALDPLSPIKGNRIAFEAAEGAGITTLSVSVPGDVMGGPNGANTDLGCEEGQGDTKCSKASSFFVEDVTFGGNLGLFENGIEATASFGLLSLVATATCNVDESTGKFFGADVNLAIVNPDDGASRVTVDAIVDAI